MALSKISRKYQVVIPREVRDQLKLKAGVTIRIQPIDSERAIIMKQPKSYVQALRGVGKNIWQSLGGGDKYIRQERSLWDR